MSRATSVVPTLAAAWFLAILPAVTRADSVKVDAFATLSTTGIASLENFDLSSGARANAILSAGKFSSDSSEADEGDAMENDSVTRKSHKGSAPAGDDSVSTTLRRSSSHSEAGSESEDNARKEHEGVASLGFGSGLGSGPILDLDTVNSDQSSNTAGHHEGTLGNGNLNSSGNGPGGHNLSSTAPTASTPEPTTISLFTASLLALVVGAKLLGGCDSTRPRHP
jgi:hypothetical protein